MDLARAPRRTARKKGSGYANDPGAVAKNVTIALLAGIKTAVLFSKRDAQNSDKKSILYHHFVRQHLCH
jgi:hypothetical protein